MRIFVAIAISFCMFASGAHTGYLLALYQDEHKLWN